MSDFVVHSMPGSPYGRAVFATLEEKRASYRLVPVTPETVKGEPHLSRHPWGRVRVLEHGDLMLYETQAILRYLDRVLPAPVLTPAAPQAAALMDQVMNVCDWYLFQGVANVIGFQRIVRPRLLGQPGDEAAIAKAMPKAHTVINELSRLLGGKQYFTGDAVTLAGAAARLPQPDAGMGCVDGQDCQSRRLARSHEGARQLRRNDLGAHRRARRGGLTRCRARLRFWTRENGDGDERKTKVRLRDLYCREPGESLASPDRPERHREVLVRLSRRRQRQGRRAHDGDGSERKGGPSRPDH